MITYDASDTKSALQAKYDAQKIAFGQIVFQATSARRDLGKIEMLYKAKDKNVTAAAISEKTGISLYGVKTLLEIGLSSGIARLVDDNCFITKTGFFLLKDELTRVNINFINDVCYKGLFDLKKAITDETPAGLKVFGEWDTIYEGLSSLPKDVQTSWFEFDHYYSDVAFPKVLPLVFSKPVKTMLDVGGNTGKWAIKATQFDSDVQVTIVDLPGQLAKAKKNVEAAGLSERVNYHTTNLLSDEAQLPKGADAIWMSQFLDCFSQPEITSILKRAVKAMTPNTFIYILETYWDRQRFEAAAFSLHATSLYFTAMANGNSKMYHSDEMKACIADAGLKVVQQIDDIGIGHTLIECKLA